MTSQKPDKTSAWVAIMGIMATIVVALIGGYATIEAAKSTNEKTSSTQQPVSKSLPSIEEGSDVSKPESEYKASPPIKQPTASTRRVVVEPQYGFQSPITPNPNSQEFDLASQVRSKFDLASQVRSKLEANIPGGSLEVQASEDGTVTVSGIVPNQNQHDKIASLSGEIKGVKTIVNKTTVAE
jgi:cell division protein FtsN